MDCMVTGSPSPCQALVQQCNADTECKGLLEGYYHCVIACTMTPTEFPTCAVDTSGGCNGSQVTNSNYMSLQACACASCTKQCPQLCN
jgi:hypothetical protein